MDKNTGKGHIIILMVMYILVNGSRIKRMVMVFSNIQMVQFMMGNGSMINHVIKEKLSIQIKINMKAIS